jgi:hypothetical protein
MLHWWVARYWITSPFLELVDLSAWSYFDWADEFFFFCHPRGADKIKVHNALPNQFLLHFGLCRRLSSRWYHETRASHIQLDRDSVEASQPMVNAITVSNPKRVNLHESVY